MKKSIIRYSYACLAQDGLCNHPKGSYVSTQKYLKSVHLKLTTCCLKIYPVVLSFNTHYRILSNPQSQKIPSECIPQSQKFSSKRIPQSQNFQAKNYPKLAHIPILPIVKYPPPGASALVETKSVCRLAGYGL